MSLYARSLAAGLVLTALAATAHGQANNVTLFRTNIHNQTGAIAADYLGTFLAAQINVPNASNYGAATLLAPDGSTYNFAQTGVDYYYGAPLFPTVAALEAAYPHGDYVYSLAADNDPADALALTDAQDRFSPDVPLAAEYNALQAATAGQAITVHVAGFTPGIGTNDNLSFYNLFDTTTNAFALIGNTNNANAYSFDIPGGTLQANHGYVLTLYYSSRLDVPNAGLGGATAFLGYDQLTTINFRPVPEPATFAALGVGALVVLRRRRR